MANYRELKEAKINFLLTDEKELNNENAYDILFFSKNDNGIDLKLKFKELILFEQEMKNICKDDCKGLCTICGIDLNNKSCDCFSKLEDNPWKVLEKLKDS